MEKPVILRTHGARLQVIEIGRLQIDVALIGSSAADDYGICTGCIGPNACGALRYSMVDAHNAGCVVAITDNLVESPCVPASISQRYVGFVVKVDQIGRGVARLTKSPRDLMIAERTVDLISDSCHFRESFFFQTGAGVILIAITKYLAERMKERGVKTSFALGSGPTWSVVHRSPV